MPEVTSDTALTEDRELRTYRVNYEVKTTVPHHPGEGGVTK